MTKKDPDERLFEMLNASPVDNILHQRKYALYCRGFVVKTELLNCVDAKA